MFTRTRACIVAFTAMWMMSVVSPAKAENWTQFSFKQHVNQALKDPAVAMVVTYFGAEHCDPCVEDIPRWRQLKRTWGPRGVHFVVVRVEDAINRGEVWGWADRETWDDDGRIREQWAVQSLPQAFVWTWRGKLAVNRGSFDEVERAIRTFIEEGNLRVVVEAETNAESVSATTLRSWVEAALLDDGKFHVVVDERERDALQKAREGTHAPGRKDCQRLQDGEGISPNAKLKVKQQGVDLMMQLVDMETECTIWRGDGRYENTRAGVRSLAKGLSRQLVTRLQRPATMPATGRGDERLLPQASLKIGTLFLISDTPGTTWEVEGTGRTGVLEGKSREPIQLPTRDTPYRVRFSKAGYYPESDEIMLTQTAPVATFSRQMARRVTSVKKEGTGHLLIASTPSNAEVLIDGVLQEHKTARPHSTYPVTAGTHTVRVRRPAYRDWTGEVTIEKADHETVNARLAPNFAPLRIQTEPSQAEIRLNGTRVGTGEYTNSQQIAGGYQVEITAPLHHPRQETVFVEAGKPLSRTYRLKPAYGNVLFAVQTTIRDDVERQPEVFLDGAPISVPLQLQETPSGMIYTGSIKKVPSGRHELEFQLERFNTIARTIEVSDGEETTMEDTFSAAFGKVTITSEPSGARVSIDGKHRGATPLTRNVDVGNRTVRLSTDSGYHRPITRQVYVAQEAQEEIHATFEVITGRLNVYSQPSGAQIILDGVPQGTTPLKLEDIPIGARRLEAKLAGFTPTVVEVTVREDTIETPLIELQVLGSVEVRCIAPAEDSAGISIRLDDGAPVFATTHRYERLSEGTYVVTCHSPRGHSADKTVSVSPGELTPAVIDLTDPAVLLGAWEDRRRMHIWTGVALAVLGVAGGIVGGVFLDQAMVHDAMMGTGVTQFGMAASVEEVTSARQAILNAQSARGDDALVSYIALGVGGAALAAAIVTWATIPARPDVDEAKTWGAIPRVAPFFRADAAGLSVRTRF